MKLQYLFACLGLAAATGLGAASCTAGAVDPDEPDPEPGAAPETPEADTPEADEEDVSSDSEALSCLWNGQWCNWDYQCCSGWCRWHSTCASWGGGGGGCRSNGQWCSYNAECCSYNCYGGYCYGY